MDLDSILIELEELLIQHGNGLYTDGEITSLCLEVMGRNPCRPVWEAMPEHVRSALVNQLGNFSDNDEVVTFGRASAREAKKEMLRLKAWLENRDLI
ncbi:hypothetical protein AAFM71_00090 [Chromobacterium violaceum]|uniref:hypothetical protein n=1 Tax=Chromobacterium violaceum TaxID=536 RepID=UPI0012D33406|nr:hypothetical protein [Chromobacterium violaceum]MBA8735680.1 hypothetical protein [Chromobacterium violaceum]